MLNSMWMVPGATAGSSDRLHLWWLPNPDPQAPTLLYLHGTFRNLYQNYRKVEALREAGFAVVAVDYRGWGDSSPIIPSEATIYADANVAWAELVRRQSDPRKRVIFGHSMGSGVAVELASQKRAGVDYGGLILESSFTRLPDVASAAGTVGTIASWFATQEFDSLSKIGKVDAPILMMHGAADKTVPIALGRQPVRGRAGGHPLGRVPLGFAQRAGPRSATTIHAGRARPDRATPLTPYLLYRLA